MEWFFDNLGKLIPIIIALIYFLGSLKNRGRREEGEEDPEAHERARKVQEEIRRKILERQKTSRPAPAQPVRKPISHEEPALRQRAKRRYRDELHPREPKSARETAPSSTVNWKKLLHPTPPPIQTTDISVELEEEQLRIEEQLAKADNLRKLASAAPVARSSPIESGPLLQSRFRNDIMRQLDSAHDLRKAFALKEILDGPLATR